MQRAVTEFQRVRFHNLLGATNIIAEWPVGIDYRRIHAMHWVDDLQVGDWLRWNPMGLRYDGNPDIRHYVVLSNVMHPERAHEGVMLATMVAPVPNVTVAGATYWGPQELPPMPDILHENRFRWEKPLWVDDWTNARGPRARK